MDVRTIGLHKIYVAPITDLSSTVMPDNNTANDAHWVDLGDVYEGTAKLTDDDPEVTTHKSETSAKKITLSDPGDCKLELSLMDPTLEELQRLFGGTISTVTPLSQNGVITFTVNLPAGRCHLLARIQHDHRPAVPRLTL